MRILLGIIILIGLVTIIVASYGIGRTTLTAEELAQVRSSCAQCHEEPVSPDEEEGNVHQIHANTDCVTCHSSASGLETADNAHNVLQWTGIGIVALAAAGLVLNYAVARVRLAGRKGGDGKTND